MLSKLKSNKYVKNIVALLDSNYYPLIVFFVVLITHVLALDIWGFIITVLLLSASLVLSDDLRPAVPSILMFPYIVSTQNSPGYGSSEYYSQQWILTTFVCLFALIVLSLIARLVLTKEYKNLFKGKKLLLSFLVLIPTYILAGVFSKYYNFTNFFICIMMVFLHVIIYMFFAVGIKKREDNITYLSNSAVLTLLLICLEVIFVYILKYKIGTPLDILWKNEIVLGSLVSNSAGELIVILMPFCTYLAYKQKRGYIYYLIEALALVVVYFTLSRASLLFAIPTFIISTIILCFKSENKALYRIISVLYIIGLLVAFLMIKAFGNYNAFIEYFKASGLDSHNRFEIWKELIINFKQFPIFGVGFSSTHQLHPEYPTVFQALAHNTIIQIVASTGIIGTVFFAYHIITAISIFVKKPNMKVLTIGFSLLLFLGTSLFDQIFFFPNFAVLYPIFLIFAEKETEVKNE